MRYTEAAERRDELERALAAVGYVSSVEMSRRLDVSEMTIRRDLRLLESRGIARRVAGGAALPGGTGIPFERRDTVDTASKRAIATVAAAAVSGARSVALDAGTTVAAVAPLLGDMTIVTHSLPVITAVASLAPHRLVAAGGHYQPDTRSFAGPLAEAMLQGVRCEVALLSATAVSGDAMWGTNVLDAAIKRILAEHSDTVILLADGTKLGRTAALRIAPLDVVDIVITDRSADDAALAGLRDRGLEVRIAQA